MGYLDHLGFYYQRYYKKTLSPKFFGKEDYVDLMKLVKDTIFFKKPLVIESQLWEDIECLGVFVKLTEEARRKRLLQIDLGDDSVKIKMQQPALNMGEKAQGKSFGKDLGKLPKGDGKTQKGFGKGDIKGPPQHVPPQHVPPFMVGDKGCFKGDPFADQKGFKGDPFAGQKGGFKGDFKGDRGDQKGCGKNFQKGFGDKGFGGKGFPEKGYGKEAWKG